MSWGLFFQTVRVFVGIILLFDWLIILTFFAASHLHYLQLSDLWFFVWHIWRNQQYVNCYLVAIHWLKNENHTIVNRDLIEKWKEIFLSPIVSSIIKLPRVSKEALKAFMVFSSSLFRPQCRYVWKKPPLTTEFLTEWPF